MLKCLNKNHINELEAKILFYLTDTAWRKIFYPQNFFRKNEQNIFLDEFKEYESFLSSYIKIYSFNKITDKNTDHKLPFKKILNDFIIAMSDKIIELYCHSDVFIRYYKNHKIINFEYEIEQHLNRCLIFYSFELGKINIEINQSYVKQFIETIKIQENHYENFFYFICGRILALILIIIFFLLYYCFTSKQNSNDIVVSQKDMINKSRIKNIEMLKKDNKFTINDNRFDVHEKFYNNFSEQMNKNKRKQVCYLNEYTNEPVYQNSIVLNDLKNIDLILSSKNDDYAFYEEINETNL